MIYRAGLNEDELTATLKLKRAVVANKYAAEFEEEEQELSLLKKEAKYCISWRVNQRGEVRLRRPVLHIVGPSRPKVGPMSAEIGPKSAQNQSQPKVGPSYWERRKREVYPSCLINDIWTVLQP